MICYSKSFESRYELRDWCKIRLQQLNDPMYYEEQRLKAGEEKRLAREAEEVNIGYCVSGYLARLRPGQPNKGC
jgi:hypothetical protein